VHTILSSRLTGHHSIALPTPARELPITIDWSSAEGRQRLFESRYNRDFFQLAHHFQPQIKPTYCGVASAVMVLNGLRIESGLRIDSGLEVSIPNCHGGGEMAYNSYSQLTFLNEETDTVKARGAVEGVTVLCGQTGNIVFEPGLNLKQLAKKLRIYLLNVVTKEAKTNSENSQPSSQPVKRFRQNLMAHLNDNRTFIIANYHGRTIGKNVGGHFSPIAAYHEETDSCLIMDVAGHKHPWFWINIHDLYAAMTVPDGTQPRGYMLISDKLRDKK